MWTSGRLETLLVFLFLCTRLERDRSTPLKRSQGTRQELKKVLEKGIHKTYQCRCWTQEGERCTEFFEPLRVTVFGRERERRTKSVSPMCEHSVPDLGNSANSCSESFQKLKVVCESICSADECNEKTDFEHVLIRSAVCSSAKYLF